MLEVSVV